MKYPGMRLLTQLADCGREREYRSAGRRNQRRRPADMVDMGMGQKKKSKISTTSPAFPLTFYIPHYNTRYAQKSGGRL